MGNATLQIQNKSGRSAISRANENLRASPRFENPKIVVVANNVANTNFAKPIQKVRAQNDAEIAKEINVLKANINTYKKRIGKLEKDYSKLAGTSQFSQALDKYIKYKISANKKIASYEQKITALKEQKKIEKTIETRGRKREKDFVELIMSLPGIKPQGEIVDKFIEAQKKYLEKFFGKTTKLVLNAVHLDQHSLHSHAILQIPASTNWTSYLFKRLKVSPENTKKARTDALRQAYATMARGFQNFMAEQLDMRFDPLQNGIKYTGLKKYKLENPLEALKSSNETKSAEIPVLEEKEILEPSSDVKQLAAQGRDLIAELLKNNRESERTLK